jgi:pimeloyl-ACP methyl ester carboxylesterase
MNLRALNARSVGEITDDVDAWNNLSKIQVPVLLIAGQLDLPHLQERSARMAEIIAHSELISIKNVAHLAALEAPLPCAEMIAKFLARHMNAT